VPSSRKVVCIGFKTSSEVAERLKQLAEENQTTISDLCRRIIESYLNQKPALLKWTVLNGRILDFLKRGARIEITLERDKHGRS